MLPKYRKGEGDLHLLQQALSLKVVSGYTRKVFRFSLELQNVSTACISLHTKSFSRLMASSTHLVCLDKISATYRKWLPMLLVKSMVKFVEVVRIALDVVMGALMSFSY